MRDDWLMAMIDRDVARAAKITGQAIRHIVGGAEKLETPSCLPKEVAAKDPTEQGQ